MEIIFSELTNKLGNFNKQVTIDSEGEVSIDSAANVVSASAKTVHVSLDDVARYMDSLRDKHNTAMVLGVWREGYNDFEEYDIEVVGSSKIDPSEGVISRSKEFFDYANNDSTSLMMLDFDGNHSEEQRKEFLRDLDLILADALIGEKGHERNSICKWVRPSSSGSASIKGNTGNGLHVYLAVKNANERLIKLIHKFCWLQPYGRGHRMTAAATILAESLIDSAVASAERVVYSADITCEGEGKEEYYQYVNRECNYVPGGVIDCELACQILADVTADYDREWSAHKLRAEQSSEVRAAREAWKEKQIQKRMDSGMDRKQARKTVKSLANGILLSNEVLMRNDGTEVPVLDVLVDPDEWLGKNKFCDPIKKEQHRNVGMILGDEERQFLNSKSHGGVKYHLKWRYEDLLEWSEECDEDDLEDWLVIHVSNSVLTNIQAEKIMKASAKRLGVGVVAIRSEVKSQTEAILDVPLGGGGGGDVSDSDDIEDTRTTLGEDATHGDIISDYIRRAGDCKGYGDGLYIWNDGGTIWEKQTVSFIQKKLWYDYNHVARCARVSDYKSISVAITAEDSVSVNDWEQEYGVPCSDGFYRVSGRGEGWERVPYTKELGCRFKLGFKPDFTMPTPLFDKVIENVDNPVLYQQLFGLALTRYLHKMQKIFTMFGEGGAGKGTTNDILTAMLPSKQVTNVPLDKLNDERFLVPLVDAQINVISEVSQHKKIDLTGLKKASGGDGMSAWVLYQGQKFFTPSCSFVLNMNNWIPLKQVGSDIQRRLGQSIVRFTKRQKGQIDGLSEKIIQNELPGVLAWALEGVRLYFEHGLEDTLSLELYREWTSSVDPISLFFDECCQFSPRGKVLRSVLYSKLDEFCSESNYFTPTKGLFFERLNAVREVSLERKTSGWTAVGVGLKIV